MNKSFELISLAGADELAARAARAWLEEIESAGRAGKPHCVALSGGRIAQKFFIAAAEQAAMRAIAFAGVDFFWADERCVPPDDAESNFKLANDHLFLPLKISENQIHRIPGENPPETAARAAGAEISRIVPLNEAGQPVLDLIFLGMGEDGHVASLFPGEPDVSISDKTVYHAVNDSPKPPPNRITLSYAAIAAARQVWILVSGPGKAAVLHESLQAEGRTPLARVTQFRTRTKIFSDFPLI